MPSKVFMFAVAALLVVPPVAVSQSALPDADELYTRPESAAPAAPAELPEARLLAGVRAYPPGVLRALFSVSQQPGLMRQLAQDPQKLMKPQSITPTLSAELQAAIRQLQQAPEIVALADAYPDEVERLRQLHSGAPEQVEQRLAELRARYEAARLQASQAWEELLAQNPAALEPYRDLVSQFTRDQLREYREFPYVEIKQTEYYYAAPPNELIMAYAEDRKPGAPLDSVLNDWWTRYGPDQVDERVFSPSAPASAGMSLAALPPQERAGMWQAPADPANPGAALLPIIMQPLPDQPPDARAAYAVAENARLWAGPGTTQFTQEPPVAAAPQPLAPEQRAAPRYPAPDAGQTAPPEQAPGYVEQGPEYEYEYEYSPDYEEPQYVYTAPTVYYSSLVPYYYGYPAVWPVAYTYYPTLCSYWPYYWDGPGSYFAFSFGYGAHYYRCGYRPWACGHWGRWGHAHWGRPYARHYYGHRFHDDRRGHVRGDRGDHFGRGGGDRHGGGRGERFGSGRSPDGRGERFGSGARSDHRRGERFGGADRSGRRDARFGSGERSTGGRERFGAGERSAGRGGAAQGPAARDSNRRSGGRSSQGDQSLRRGGASRSFERGPGVRQGGSSRSRERGQGVRPGAGGRTSSRSQAFSGSSSMGSRGLGSVGRAPRTGGPSSGAPRGMHAAPRSSGGGRSMGTIRSGGGSRGGGGAGLRGGGGVRGGRR